MWVNTLLCVLLSLVAHVVEVLVKVKGLLIEVDLEVELVQECLPGLVCRAPAV